jgi:uncharacterized protein
MPVGSPETEFEGVGLLADYGSDVAVMITHPWGLLGGNKYNNVVVAAALFFQSLHMTTLRFDFTGNDIGFGTRQVRQLEQMAMAVVEQTAATKILLVGYSYGSIIAASCCTIPGLIGLIAIAPPFGVAHWLFCFHSEYHLRQAQQHQPDLPRLFVIGDADTFTDVATFETTLRKWYAGASSVVLKGVDHFFRRKEKELMDVIGAWLLNAFPHCQGELKKLAMYEQSIQCSAGEASRGSE